MTSRTAKIVVVLAAAAALSGIGAGLAAADSPAPSSTMTNYTVDGLREYIRPLDSISIPTMLCGSGGYLQDREYSPGRIVPRVCRSSNPAVSASRSRPPHTGRWTRPGRSGLLIGTDGHGLSSATNWDPTAHELQIKLHCTTDINQAAKEYVVP